MIPIKLGLKKLDEAERLLRRAEDLSQVLDRQPRPNPFKHIRFYQSYGRYCELLRGDAAAALRFFNRAKALSDSLEKQNDVRKLAKIQQRQDAKNTPHNCTSWKASANSRSCCAMRPS